MAATTCMTTGAGEAAKRASVGMSSGPPRTSTSRAVPARTGIAASATRPTGTHRSVRRVMGPVGCWMVIGRRAARRG